MSSVYVRYFLIVVTTLLLIITCNAEYNYENGDVSFGVPTFEGTDGIIYLSNQYNSTLIDEGTHWSTQEPAPLSGRFYDDGRVYIGKDTDHYIGMQPVGIYYVDYQDPTQKQKLIDLTSMSLEVVENVATYSQGPVDIIFTAHMKKIKGDIVFPNAPPVPTVNNPALVIIWEIVGAEGINTEDGERDKWWFDNAKAVLPIGDIQNNGSTELKKKIFRQNGKIFLVEGIGYNWISDVNRTDPYFIIDPTIEYSGDDNWAGTSGTLLEHGDGNLRAPPNVTTGLVSYWSPGTDVGSGTTLTDVWGDNDGTIYGATWNTSAARLDFNGSDDYVTFGQNNELQLNGPITICMDNVETYDLNPNPLFGWRGNTSMIPGIISPLSGDKRSLLYMGGSNYRYFSNTPTDLFTGSHAITAVITGSNQNDILNSSLYADGTPQDVNTTVNSGAVVITNDYVGMGVGGVQYANTSIGATLFYKLNMTQEQVNQTRDNYHTTTSYRQTDSVQDAGDYVWKYVTISGTDAGANTTGHLQINGSDDNITFNGWETVSEAYDLGDVITIPVDQEYRYAYFRWYSNTTYQPETDVIESVSLLSYKNDSTTFKSTWNTSKTSAGSSNSDQIKLPLTSDGTYNFIVWWGDGSEDTITTYNQAEVTHTYASEGEYDVVIDGTLVGWRFNNDGDRNKILNITNWGTVRLGNLGSYFYGCENLNIGATDTLDLSGTTTLFFMFRGCTNLSYLNISAWDTSRITTTYSMCYGCTGLTSFDALGCDVANITTTKYMFYGCSGLTTINIHTWITTSLENMAYMFRGCSGLTSINISAWDTSHVKYLYNTFDGCSGLTTINIHNWDIGSVTDMTFMLNDVTLTTSCYTDTLNYFASQTTQASVPLHGGNSKYYVSAEVARNVTLITDNSWTITDGGLDTSYAPTSLHYNATTNYYQRVDSSGTILTNRTIISSDATNWTAYGAGNAYWYFTSDTNPAGSTYWEIDYGTVDNFTARGLTPNTNYKLYKNGNPLETQITDNNGNVTIETNLSMGSYRLYSCEYYSESLSTFEWAVDMAKYMVTNIGTFIVTAFSIICIIILMFLIGGALSITNIIFR